MGEILRSRTLALGLLITLVVVLGIAIGPMVTPFPAEEMDFVNVLTPPDATHWLGTDSYGRDVLSRILSGGRISFLVSFAGVLGGAAIGTAIGMTAAWRGGRWETLMMAGCDLLFAFPSFVLALFMMVVLGFGTQNVILAIGLTYLPIFARLARNLTRTLMPEPYVQAARLMGQGPARILVREILPNILSPLMVQVSVGVAFGIVIEAGLSFLGLGVQPPTPSLGVILADGREYFQSAPWVLTLTGLVVSVALLGLNLLGDGLRDLADPRLRRAAGP
ncbi:ABC transporter permease [Roseomonas gilardii]|uniref:ABC transporter permease n=1 Tax=Roseomonas gilardii TaxID=257708 RepID=A0ABU3MDK8_9PROT|nr:ABC transporter permease [Roseomonas gilardii]MDT8331011.1 ABC transporter permease [Roseomonas gilardii]